MTGTRDLFIRPGKASIEKLKQTCMSERVSHVEVSRAPGPRGGHLQ